MAVKKEAFEQVELGFLDKETSSQQTTSDFFPSKVGGKPVWLDPVHLPSPEQLQCRHCRNPCLLLLQMYAPHSDQPETYHRSLFIFMCPDAKCHDKEKGSLPFRVLRCHLPRGNPYYPSDIEDSSSHMTYTEDDNTLESLVEPSPLCGVCGCPAPNRCGQCRKVHYCSRHHQLLDWKDSHKINCKELKEGKDPALVGGHTGLLWSEYDIVTEIEPPSFSPTSEEQRMSDYKSYVNSNEYKKSQDDLINDQLTEDLLNTSIKKKDKTFSRFKKRISIEPEQVIRFQPGGHPLLMSNKPSQLPPSIIPPCDKCQSPRQFECQVMPQLLYYLKLEYYWTLFVYTCSSNCASSPGYTEEFLWKQDP